MLSYLRTTVEHVSKIEFIIVCKNPVTHVTLVI